MERFDSSFAKHIRRRIQVRYFTRTLMIPPFDFHLISLWLIRSDMLSSCERTLVS